MWLTLVTLWKLLTVIFSESFPTAWRWKNLFYFRFSKNPEKRCKDNIGRMKALFIFRRHFKKFHHQDNCVQNNQGHNCPLKRRRDDQAPNTILKSSFVFRHKASQRLGWNSKIDTSTLILLKITVWHRLKIIFTWTIKIKTSSGFKKGKNR